MQSIIRILHFFLLKCNPLAALAVVVALLLAACTAVAPEGAPAADVARENTLIFATDMSDLLTLDPALVYEYSGVQVVGSVYETLVGFEPGQQGIQPLLADAWEIEDSGDVWTLTFALNTDAIFASGNPITAADVVYSWSRALEINGPPAFLFANILQLTNESFTAVDDKTLELTVPKTVSPQVALSVLAFPMAAVVEQAALEAHLGSDMGASWLNDHSVGSGPYVLDRWERSAQVTLNANSNYWRGAPAMQRVFLQHVGELANLQAMIETGDADIVQDLGTEQAAALEGNPDVQLIHADLNFFVYVAMNTMKPPFDNADVREAIRYAINYDDFTNLLAGNGQVMQEIIPAGYPGHTGKTYFTQEIDKAKELLAQAGVAEGTEIDYIAPTGFAPGGLEQGVIAAKIQSDLARIGLVLNIRQLPASEVVSLYRARAGHMVQLYWSPDFSDPDGYVTPFTNYDVHSHAWRNGWDNPEIAEMGRQAALEQMMDVRAELYAEIVERVAHEGPYLILYQPARVFGVRSNVTGFLFDAVDIPGITFANIGKN
jgi:peptide/nickel transport system substrate-binding protein